jgi:hypothetical protein
MQITSTDLDPLIACCIGRRDEYAIQQSNGRYLRAYEPLTYARLYQHLAGDITIGTYAIGEENTSTFAVFDSDQPDGLLTLVHLQEHLRQHGIVSYLECSRRGGHLWVLCLPTHPALLRAWLLPFCPVGVEFYPKQDHASRDHPGSLIRVPFGVHRLSGERYPFVSYVHGELVPLVPSLAHIFPWCAAIDLQRNTVPSYITTLPGKAAPSPTNTQTYPSHPSVSTDTPTQVSLTIREWCMQQDPVAVISRYVQLDSRGMGSCPFGAHHDDGVDTHPSFRAYYPTYPDVCCWYCQTWQQGGSLFDFLKLYYSMSARDLWIALQQGARF